MHFLPKQEQKKYFSWPEVKREGDTMHFEDFVYESEPAMRRRRDVPRYVAVK